MTQRSSDDVGGEGLAPGARSPQPGELVERRGEIEDSGLFL